jgi:hypothetical protein
MLTSAQNQNKSRRENWHGDALAGNALYPTELLPEFVLQQVGLEPTTSRLQIEVTVSIASSAHNSKTTTSAFLSQQSFLKKDFLFTKPMVSLTFL